MDSIRHEDDVLLQRLGSIVDTVDPVPDLVRELGRAAYDTRLLDQALATLVQDTASGLLAGARSVATGSRLLAFDADGVEIDVEVRAAGRNLTLVGQLLPAPASGGRARLQTAAGERYQAAIDDEGCFEFTGVEPVLFRLWFSRAGSRPIVTGWLHP